MFKLILENFKYIQFVFILLFILIFYLDMEKNNALIKKIDNSVCYKLEKSGLVKKCLIWESPIDRSVNNLSNNLSEYVFINSTK